jgi:hypothetical protein
MIPGTSGKIVHDIELEPWKGVTITAEVEIEYEIEPYWPAKVNGPPEKCYDAEGGGCEWWPTRVLKAWYTMDGDTRYVVDADDPTPTPARQWFAKMLLAACDPEVGELDNEEIDRLCREDAEGRRPER